MGNDVNEGGVKDSCFYIHFSFTYTGMTIILGPFRSPGSLLSMGDPLLKLKLDEQNGPRIAVSPVLTDTVSVSIFRWNFVEDASDAC